MDNPNGTLTLRSIQIQPCLNHKVNPNTALTHRASMRLRLGGGWMIILVRVRVDFRFRARVRRLQLTVLGSRLDLGNCNCSGARVGVRVVK